MQAPGHLRGRGSGMADQHQQHLDDEVGREGSCEIAGAAGGEASLASLQLTVAGRAGAEVDIDATKALAAGALVAHGSQQEGVHGDLQEGAEFLVGPARFGFGEEALDRRGEGAVAGEVDSAEREQAEAVEASGIALGIEATVVVIAAQVGDLAEVAEGGARGDLAESSLELFEGDGGAGSQQGDEQVGGALGHNVIAYTLSPAVPYTLTS